MADPLAVGCPDCAAPAGTACRMGDPDGPELHADRITAAEHAGMTVGVCEACGLPAAPPLGCPAHGYTAVVEAAPDEVLAVEARELLEEGRRLASRREDLIARGVDPSALVVPLAPGDPLCDGSCGDPEPHGLHTEPNP